MNFPGFNNWIEIFRGGLQTDSLGRHHDGDRLIEEAVGHFKPHTVPLVVGHPKTDSPAFGWVSDLRKVVKGGVSVLEARFDQVLPEFEQLVRQGTYKKRSASFFPDGRGLKHVGFLGGAAPAVTGLKDIGFAGSPGVDFEFNTVVADHRGGNGMLNFNSFQEFIDAAKAVFSKDKPAGPTGQPEKTPASFSEADLEKARNEAAETARKQEREKIEAEFADQQATAQAEARKAAIKKRVDALVKNKKISPAYAEQELTPILMAADTGAEIEFGLGETKQKGSPAEAMLFRLEQQPENPIFTEFAVTDKAAAEFAEAEKDWKTGAEIASRVAGK
jgi:hypothetical protein